MSFRYFAYGSNLWPPQMRARARSAQELGLATLPGWAPVYDKPSMDGSAKLSIRQSARDAVEGVLYEIDEADRESLDRAEPGYEAFETEVVDGAGERVTAVVYRRSSEATVAEPYDWYVAMVEAGARHHGLPEAYVAEHLSVAADPDPLAPGIRPATPADLPAMQGILSAGLQAGGDRYTVHPGDLAWWIFHADPRYDYGLTYWLQGESGLLVIDERKPEVNAFGRLSDPVIPLIEWAQRRVGGAGEVGFVADDDTQLVSYLQAQGYEAVWTDRSYEWDLESQAVPDTRLPTDWDLRFLTGEEEANNRREAAHSSFRSTMSPEMHLERYLGFMRSPVYDPERDLIAVAPDGRIASFMVWWPDGSGIAQIEPFGTHTDFQRMGIGSALIHYGLRRMKKAGMRLCRVATDEVRSDATEFYESVGFTDVGRVRWWRKT